MKSFLSIASTAGLVAGSYIAQIPLGDGQTADKAAPAVVGSRKEIDSEALQATVDADKLFEMAKDLYKIAKRSEDEYNHPTRVIGSEGHAGTLEYIHKVLGRDGVRDYYDVSSQVFPAIISDVNNYRLVLGQLVPNSTTPFRYTPSTKDREPVFADLALADNLGCDASDFPKEVAGRIVVIRRGECNYSQKSANAGRAGAVSAVIVNSEDAILHGTLGDPHPDHVPTFGISLGDGKPVLETLEKGEALDAIAYMDAELKTVHTTNVIAQTKGGDQDNCVMLGAHSDGVSEGPGINDDGSGTISLLQVATELTAFEVNNCVRFAWWSGEEEGLLGSDYYVDQLTPEENLEIRVFMDYDMMASPNFAYQVYNATNAENPVGSEELRDLYVDWYTQQGLNYTFIPFDGRSDYSAFILNGIPGGGIATGAEGVKTKEEEEVFGGVAGDWYDPCYHQLCDDLGNVNMTAWEVNTKLIAHSVATYAKSLDGLPERSLDVSKKAVPFTRKYRNGQ